MLCSLLQQRVDEMHRLTLATPPKMTPKNPSTFRPIQLRAPSTQLRLSDALQSSSRRHLESCGASWAMSEILC